MKCYVCGHGSEGPFAKMNATIRQRIHKSCDEFDRIPLEEKFKYEMECPETSVGCTLNVKGESLSRAINHAENIERHEASDKIFRESREANTFGVSGNSFTTAICALNSILLKHE